MIRVLIALCLFVITSVNGAAAEEITIAAASDLNFVFRELIAEHERSTGDHVRLSLGSSGNFYAQIQQGAPFDLYFSADIAYPRKLEEAGLTVPGSLYPYAIGRIVLWAGKDSGLDLSKGMDVLLEPTIKKIAIANPKHAPYGRAAVAAM
ncbi:MAG: molybdate ABC transporter substrate-binding protein, partial [Nitrospirota bacterium]